VVLPLPVLPLPVGGQQPSLPYAGLIADSEGNFYGTTEFGGQSNQGTVFKVSPSSGGGWTETVLYEFGASASDGAQPHGGLLFDSAGNLYGTTNFGGSANCAPKGCGTVFKLAPGSGTWSESVLYAFTGGINGQDPNARLALDSQGNLYGTTLLGGNLGKACASGCGTVFRLAPGSSWQMVYAFNGGNDGSSPYAGVTLDAKGNLYGTTSAGGSHGSGTVFELSPGSSDGWTESVLHSFTGGADGKDPLGGVILDAAGNLYGTTFEGGGPGNYGVVFKLLPRTGGWHEVVLHTFCNSPAANPMAGLVFDAAGNLYGTTALGAPSRTCGGGCGTLFKLAPGSTGGWAFSALHEFGHAKDGQNPTADLILDSTGNLWGTTKAGGSQGSGTVFQVVP
jgi:uncharacterized repeat protein (TIGR03803 family)